MPDNVPFDLQLTYLDSSNDSQPLPGGLLEIINPHVHTSPDYISTLTEFSLTTARVSATDPWANRPIGITLVSPYDPGGLVFGASAAGGYWDVDNVRLTAVPEPTSILLISLLAAGAGLRRRPRNGALRA